MIQLSEIAAEKIKGIISEQTLSEQGGLRIYANSSGCGCSGGSYGMALDEQQRDEDNVFESQGVRLLVDPVSFAQLEGASVDYYKDDQTEGFRIDKPQAQHNCKCGGGCNC